MVVNKIDTLYLTGQEYEVSEDIKKLIDMDIAERDEYCYHWLVDHDIEVLGTPYILFKKHFFGGHPQEAWIINVRYKK